MLNIFWFVPLHLFLLNSSGLSAQATRDPAKWEASMKQTILPAIDILRANKNRTPYQQALLEWFEEDMLGLCLKLISRRHYLVTVMNVVSPARYHGGLLEKDTQRAIIVHNERIKKLIPADKLLLYNVAEGWGSLCAYLGVYVLRYFRSEFI